jgi:transposase
VRRYNAEGLAGLRDRPHPGPAPRLTPEQLAELARIVEDGPDPARDGVVRWRRVDLQVVIERRFGVHLHKPSVGKVLRCLGFARLSVRPKRPSSDPEALGQDRLDLAQAQAEAVVEPDGVADDLGRKVEAVVEAGLGLHARQPATSLRPWPI